PEGSGKHKYTSPHLIPRPLLSLKEPKIPLPDKCNSNCDKFQGFLNQCHLLFLLRPQSFPTDQSRVRLIISLLTGEALAWASPFLEKASSLLGHFTGTVCVGDGIAGGDFT
uniref:DUF4939 domain-containing protein n=1 Tax=Chrysemys picta bellii TaxID=8478 RepID=A0A8C3HQ15_CHRPI